MYEKNGILLVVVALALVVLFAVANYNTPTPDQPEKPQVNTEEKVSKPQEPAPELPVHITPPGTRFARG